MATALPSPAQFEREAWRDRALCAEIDTRLFFPDRGESVTDPKRVCAGCEVRAECLEYALDNEEEHGVWGGTSGNERKALLKARDAAAA